MCTCTSCHETDKLAKAGFAEWPRGNPTGRKATAEYQGHVRYGQQWGRSASGAMHQPAECTKTLPRAGTRREDPHVYYKFPGTWHNASREHIEMPETTAGYVALFEKLNNLKPVPPNPERPAEMSTASLLLFARKLREQARVERQQTRRAA